MESSSNVRSNRYTNDYSNFDMTDEQSSIHKYSDLDVGLKFVQSLLTKKIENGVSDSQIQLQAEKNANQMNGEMEDEDIRYDEPAEDSKMYVDDNQVVETIESPEPRRHDQDNEISSQHAVNQSHQSINGVHNVEERLQIMNSIYQERRRQKLAEAEEARKKQDGDKKPKINRKSEKMLKNKGDRVGKVEDRLMNIAKKKVSFKDTFEDSYWLFLNQNLQTSKKILIVEDCKISNS